MTCKSVILLTLLIPLLFSRSEVLSQDPSFVNVANGGIPNDGSVYAIGNGKMLVYEKGPNIIKMYPGPYSSPEILKMDIISNDKLETVSTREPGTAIWTHELSQDGKLIGTFIDFIDAELPCMIRHFKLTEKISFHLRLMDYAEVIKKVETLNSDGQNGSLLLMVPAGTIFYQKYAYPRPLYHQIVWRGNAEVEQTIDKKGDYLITILPGESDLYFVGGPEYPQTIEYSEEVQILTFDRLLERTKIWWKNFTARRTDFEHQLPSNLPLRDKLLRIIDDVSIMIKTQQSHEGSVLAGYSYPLAYVRDQYGVSRGLLALGYFEEAKSIMEFYRIIWGKYGVIHNAQGIGLEGVFHIHENDEVEIPGYLIVQAFDLLNKTGDEKFMELLFPMLEWCWEVQKKNLARGMLPFNGDETYVAGGFLPRSSLNDGSAEATMLFIEGGDKLLNWIQTHNKWSVDKLENERKVLGHTTKLFRENFWKNAQLITNNPDRVNLFNIPRFRHGVCERNGPDCIIFNARGSGGIDWVERDKNNRYQCPACLALGPLPKIGPHTYNLISVSLIPLYMHSSLFKAAELKPAVEKVYDNYEKSGILATVFDSADPQKNNRTVGYDFGLLLFSMLETGMGNTESVYRQTLSVADSAGVWSEYYTDNHPDGTRYRPWESAINIEALIRYANQYKK